MKLKMIFNTIMLVMGALAIGQSKPIIVPTNLNLPKDTITTNSLIKSLNGFLGKKEKPNKENTFILNENLLETSVLVDEMKEIEKSGKFKDNNFYKGYLNNVVQLDKNNFLVQFSYIGINENSPTLVASFELLAFKKENQFYFSSPLKRNTLSWKTKKIDNYVFHYKNDLNEKKVSEYAKTVTFFDEKLNSKNKKIEWYGCDDMPELLRSIGVSYKLDYNGRNSSTFTALENNSLLIVSGSSNSEFNSFDPHDLWHERLQNVIPRNITNKPIDEGCAYLYGGSWGISWKQILKTFKEKVSSNPKVDWLATYDDFFNFGETNQNNLLVPYVLNALLVEKIEKEKGFSSVLEFLSCGKYQKGNENYFISLEKLTGINKSNFNENIWTLINKSIK
jgi:hypothetical protein